MTQTLEPHESPPHAHYPGDPEHAQPAYPAGGWAAGAPMYVAPPPGRFASFWLRMQARAPRWLAPVAIVVCFAGAVGYVLGREPIDGAGDQTSCLLKYTTGYDCPGCGGTRAFFFLIQGNLPAAARHHVVFVFAVPFLLYLYLAWAGNKVFGWNLPQLRPGPKAIGIFLGGFAAFSVLRNLPWEPFTWFYV